MRRRLRSTPSSVRAGRRRRRRWPGTVTRPTDAGGCFHNERTVMPLPGEHYCVDHQGNTSHYADHNCTVCRLQKAAAALVAELEQDMGTHCLVCVRQLGPGRTHEDGCKLEALKSLLPGEG